jgi:hypothetical protein
MSCLRAHAFPVELHATAVIESVQRVLSVPLMQSADGIHPPQDRHGGRVLPADHSPLERKDGNSGKMPAAHWEGGRPPETGSGFTLAQVPCTARLTELEFCFPLRKVATEELRAVFAKHGRDETAQSYAGQMGRLEFNPIAGFMKGFMDLVFERAGQFYLVDWKSNWLGNRVEDYDGPGLAAEMRAHHYPLQYHLYTLALDRYLALRVQSYDYERHFGGVIYVFLRGVDPARPGFGVFRDRPAPELMRELRGVLLEEGK